MKPVWAIARQTFWEGMRMRIVLVSVVVLVLIILRLPYIMRGDETLAGRLQTFLAYSFGALGLFASLATVFFSCSTLANEIKNCQLHMVVTKPVSRFQILLGKWLGVNLLNVIVVLTCSIAIYAFARQIAGRKEQFARDRMLVRDVIWTARAAASPIDRAFPNRSTRSWPNRSPTGSSRPTASKPDERRPTRRESFSRASGS